MLDSIIGLVAATLSTIAYAPQVWQTWKSKSAAGLALPMLLLISSAALLWLIYGLRRHDLPVIIANSTTLALSGMLVFFKFWFKAPLAVAAGVEEPAAQASPNDAA
ncbi:SemiSWEET transporter [Hymenobacter sp. ASUV-10]|uniref:SemiSWEET transporter n=1 Tax=Hymenobacter aranciens TaxID=3063996 RepID=A0ABT9BHM6_9BACT|nr:SemiSWEET transporter [Hymenobacter sp. ASUV-10]MDO7877769.1 SemiSWEET transporter [Hymenobacter sp. ASUV-10]